MNRPEFDARLAQLRERIAELPPERRAALEALAQETVERHEQIVRSSLEGRRAMERLELAWEQMRAACARLAALAGAARARTAPPGLN